MKRREPPPLATWMLEHLTPGDRDEALAGDLLEVFRTGRSRDWYWRQVMAACVVCWSRALRARMPLLVFALLWSMLAPAWKVITDKTGQLLTHGWILNLGGLLPVLTSVFVWTALNGIFLWAGILIYSFSHRSFGQSISPRKLARALFIAPLIFLPAIAAAFVLMNLYSFPGLTDARLAATPLSQIADLRMPADVLRLPYFIAVVAALWGAIPPLVRKSSTQPWNESSVEYSAQSGSLALVSRLDPFQAGRFFALMVAAGLVNALIAGFVLCRLPELHNMTLNALFFRAALFVVIGGLAGIGGSWFYWSSHSSPFHENAPVPFWRFALVCASGWVWVPAMLAFGEQLSSAAAIVAMFGSYILASGLRSATASVFVSAEPGFSASDFGEHDLFAESLYRPPIHLHGYFIAICIYTAAVALAHGWDYTGAILLSASAFVFAWKKIVPSGRDEVRRDILRLYVASSLALLVTMWALLDGYGSHHAVAGTAAAASVRNVAGGPAKQKAKSESSLGTIGGYESVILWPFPEKKEIVPPLPPVALLAPGTTRPLIIRFTGAYWFTQPPQTGPEKGAHQAHGTPLNVDIQSNNELPVAMDAHQYLSSAVKTARCRMIDVEIQNSDNRRGGVSLGLFLTDSSAPGKPALYLGQQPIESTEYSNFVYKTEPLDEVLHFPVPASSNIRKFDEITILFLPDIEHRYLAPKIAIQQFQLFPR